VLKKEIYGVMMKAIVYTEYGNLDVLKLKDIDIPQPKAGEIQIEIKACAVNEEDAGIYQGAWFARLFLGFFKPKVQILGLDIAGVVSALGAGVTTFNVGDEVYGDLSVSKYGGFAEYVCAPETAITAKPSNISFEQAAALPHAAMLTLQAFLDNDRPLQPEHTLLVNGAGGAVGPLALQYARSLGVKSISGIDHGDKLAMMREAGFDHVYDYRTHDYTKCKEQYDAILDARTTKSPFAILKALKPEGRYVSIGGYILRILQVFLLSKLVYKFSGKKLRIHGLVANRDMKLLNELVEQGTLVPVLDRVYSLEEVPEALVRFQQSKHTGKIMISMS